VTMLFILTKSPIMNIASPLSVDKLESHLYSPSILRAYVRHVLAETRTNKYAPEQALEMMERALAAQKLLWKLRDEEITAQLIPISWDSFPTGMRIC
ncbi:MAG: hypothetical protein WCD18_09665, partial [Thermosynechococcaceae cyanobacterium]